MKSSKKKPSYFSREAYDMRRALIAARIFTKLTKRKAKK